MKTYTFTSSLGNPEISYHIWDCEKPKAILQISHGMAEEGFCYSEFAKFLNEQNYIVCANDHLGHGDSQITHEQLIKYKKTDGYKFVVDDIKKLHDIMSEKYPGLPYFIMGFSLGSFLFRRYLEVYPTSIDGAIIMGTGQKSKAQVGALKAMRRLFEAPKKRNFRFNLLNKIRAKRDEKLKDKYLWLFVEEKNEQKFANSWIRNYVVLIEKFYNIKRLFRVIQKKANLMKMNKDMPIFMLSGQEDIVGNYGKAVTQLYNRFKSIGIKDIELKLYPGLKHVILMSREKEKVMNDIKDWINAHLPKL